MKGTTGYVVVIEYDASVGRPAAAHGVWRDFESADAFATRAQRSDEVFAAHAVQLGGKLVRDLS